MSIHLPNRHSLKQKQPEKTSETQMHNELTGRREHRSRSHKSVTYLTVCVGMYICISIHSYYFYSFATYMYVC